MTDRSMSTASKDELSRPRPTIDAGRLGVYATLGALTGSVPLPWIPDTLARRIRGALVHDVASRHGLSLSPEARDILAEPAGGEGPRGIARQLVQYFGLKFLGRYGPAALFNPVKNAVRTWSLGYLLNRYIEQVRHDPSVRIDADEARRVRHIIDVAVVHAVTAEGHAEPRPVPPEELRDSVTQLVDAVLGATAAAPSWLVRRLDAAFDELIPKT